MKTKTVPSGWLHRDGRRLDCGPYLSGGLEAKLILEGLSARKDRLRDVTLGGMAGIFNGPRFARTYVDDPRFGVPFLGSTDILNADLTNLSLLSRKQVEASPRLVVRAGWTLITRSGTIGRMAFARKDMDGMAGSEHFLRIVPDPEKIRPGYLYAYLSSKFGVPLVVSGTYGAIVQHIEPEHIAALPVPRLGSRVESATDELVAKAAALRVESGALLETAKQQAAQAWGIDPLLKLRSPTHPDLTIVPASTLVRTSRFDAFFYGNAARRSDELITRIADRVPIKRIGDPEISVEVFETTRFGRISVDDPRFGVAFLSISDMMRGDPKAESFISRKQATDVRAVVNTGWLILPRVGQLQGVFGTVSYVPRQLDGVAVSDNNIRIVPVGEDEGAYLWAALSTDLLYQQIVRRACGTSIPYIDSKRVADIRVPWPERKDRMHVAEGVKQAMEMRARASTHDADAVRLIETAIENGAS